jgi:hypothetical protein
MYAIALTLRTVLDRLVCWPNAVEGTFPAEHRYCWVVWKPGHSDRPALWWLKTGDMSA